MAIGKPEVTEPPGRARLAAIVTARKPALPCWPVRLNDDLSASLLDDVGAKSRFSRPTRMPVSTVSPRMRSHCAPTRKPTDHLSPHRPRPKPTCRIIIANTGLSPSRRRKLRRTNRQCHSGQVQFAGTARRVLRTNWTCPLFQTGTLDWTDCQSAWVGIHDASTRSTEKATTLNTLFQV